MKYLLLLPLILGVLVVPPAFGYFHDLDIFMFDFNNAELNCPNGYDDNQKTTINLHSHQAHEYIMYSKQTNDPLFKIGHLSTSRSPSLGYHLYMLEGSVDNSARNVFATVVLIDGDDYAEYNCIDAPRIFVADLRINCDGSALSLTSRDPAGFNVTTSDYSIVCIA